MFDTDLAGGGAKLPKLIFFRSVRDAVPAFLMEHISEHSRCLRQFFQVTELQPDCDYDEVCDRHQPDLVLFESGVDSAARRIRNTSAHPHVPKLGFLYADAYDAARATFISDMEEWGVKTYFTHSVAMGEYTPEIADRLYVWPNFVDPAIFRDYGLEKVVPVLITGSQIGLYPWRNAISRVLSGQYPTMICPHFGWHTRSGSQRMLFGEKYARLLNATTFAPACGSVTRELVRKHLEIPASGACLVTERTAAMESFGFRDMENCVFATPDDVVEKLDMLLADPERLEQITRAGHDLAHSRHTMTQRSQIREWYDLNRKLVPGETIVQDGPAGGLRIVPAGARQANCHVVSGGLDRSLLRQGWELMGADRIGAAKTLFLRCLNHAFMPEALVGLAYCQLLEGDCEGSKTGIDGWLDVTFRRYGSKAPDPVAWATKIRIALCCGNLQEARSSALEFPVLRHQELDRIRDTLGLAAEPGTDPCAYRASIAPTPSLSEPEWRLQMLLMLRACGQDAIASALEAGRLPAMAIDGRSGSAPAKRNAAAPRRSVSLLAGRAKARLRGLKRTLTENDWTVQIDRLIACEPAFRAVIVDPSLLSLGQRAFRRSLRNNPWLPEIVEMRGNGDGLSFRPGDLVYVTAKAAQPFDPARLVDAAGVVLIEGANLMGAYRLTEALSTSADFSVVLHDVQGKVGYAIFRRRAPQFAWGEGLLCKGPPHRLTAGQS